MLLLDLPYAFSRGFPGELAFENFYRNDTSGGLNSVYEEKDEDKHG